MSKKKTHVAGSDGRARCGRRADGYVSASSATCGSCALVERCSEHRHAREQELRVEIEQLNSDLGDRRRRLARELSALSHNEVVRREKSIMRAVERIGAARVELRRIK